MKSPWIAAVVVVGLAGAALAHGGVKNPAVMARMNLMERIKQATATLGDMAKGSTAFDAGQAAKARARLIDAAGDVTVAFAAPETDPKSEALPAIWDDRDRFNAAAKALVRAAKRLDPSSPDGLRAGFGAVGKSCSDCHDRFRVRK